MHALSQNRKTERRILSLWFARLPTDRLARRRKAFGKPDKTPLVVAAKVENALRLYAVDATAAKLGLSPGMALTDARARIPSVAVANANEAADTKLLEQIADWCERYTPLVALDPVHGLLLDVTGVAHLFGGERALLQHIGHAITRQGFAVHLALAGTSAAARALAYCSNGVVVATGEDAAAVASLPLSALCAEPGIVDALRRAGLKTIGQVAERGRAELRARFSSAFVALMDATLGKIETPITPRLPVPDLIVERNFSEPVTTEDAIASTLMALAESLARVLEQRGEGARRITASFFRADGAMYRITIETGQPTRDPKIVARLFRERLGSLCDPLDPGFGFDLIRMSADFAQRLEAENVGFDTEASDHDIALLIDRLSARFGRQNVLRLQIQDTHIPEAQSVALPAQCTSTGKSQWPAQGQRRPLRLFVKPELIEVMAQVPDGPPLRFRWRCALHAVVHAAGPERIAMEWWKHQEHRPTRDYFRVEDEAGHRFWIYRDGIPGREAIHPRWYMHGLFA